MLKKFAMMTVASFLALTMINGQSIGFEFGGHFRNLLLSDQFNEVFDSPFKIGGSIGANALIPLGSQRLQLFPAVRYITKGGDLKVDENLGSVDGVNDGKMRLSYLEFAPQLQIRFSEDSKSFFLAGGPTLNLGIGGKCDHCLNKSAQFGSTFVDDFKSLTFGVNLSGGIIRTNEETSKTFFSAINIGFGFDDVRTEGGPYTDSYRTQPTLGGILQNFYIGLNFGYLFPLYTH
ncbi:outer membrane beta-barrel protein [Haliscomenobacter hydrossis]|uniref:Outer membrane protein beta-barrel domain-containing protein n=1 Tax=Haliscomenobacter hydrossis (strain ATCC 27775 / DSM 1100 / LMG 10767 / O) TaxID=760192 RepID=F4KUK8_HALH1|nr:outer membrane beta-barrel protein [Haliscomenobacter hydrossis]AEE52444.1 hypothetical protein Halhy_4607 [Haliscomenobacter hydrossis DSM 1100]